ncbi:hypothetical protein BMYO_1644 [Bifidobacterium myosotis]|uniref:Uncharacterized protein n=1 Tax=Bifidobacterium myosotis TaxID=1630166 RepID=A0A261FHL5_9BIFI|nr:hypothetical protein BMYO_1644 [Bifidobacterium myosotis]
MIKPPNSVEELGGDATQGLRIVALATTGGPEAALTNLTVKPLRLASSTSAKLPSGILEHTLPLRLVQDLYGKRAVHAFAIELHRRAATAHHATGAYPDHRFGVVMVVDQQQIHHAFDDPFHHGLVKPFAQQPVPQRPR